MSAKWDFQDFPPVTPESSKWFRPPGLNRFSEKAERRRAPLDGVPVLPMSYFLLRRFGRRLTDSFTVLGGSLRTVDCFTNRPVMAERPRLPEPPVLFLVAGI